MQRRKLIILLACTCHFGAGVATAASGRSPVFPKTITVTWEGSDANEPNSIRLRRNGTSLCEWGVLRIDLYKAALYLEEPSRKERDVIESDQVKHLRLHFVRDLSRKQMRRAYSASFRANAGKKLSDYRERIDRFIRLIPAVKKGDCLTFTCFPGRGLEVRRGETLLGVIPGDDFGKLFVRLYVGPIPPTQAVRKGLLGLTEDA